MWWVAGNALTIFLTLMNPMFRKEIYAAEAFYAMMKRTVDNLKVVNRLFFNG